jgi:hypothetical protein
VPPAIPLKFDLFRSLGQSEILEHDPGKRETVSQPDHAQTIAQSDIPI